MHGTIGMAAFAGCAKKAVVPDTPTLRTLFGLELAAKADMTLQ
jgi:hypothetical protein